MNSPKNDRPRSIEPAVCMTALCSAESDRPKNFATKDNTDVVFVFERVKKDMKP